MIADWEADSDIVKLVPIAREAARIVLAIYQNPFEVEWKGPSDPVTAADREANRFITEALTAAFPDDGIVAEESVPADPVELRHTLDRPRVFFVDPVDGTKEFAARNGEFSVMIGLSIQGRAEVGVLAVPVTGELYLGRRAQFAVRLHAGDTKQLVVSDQTDLSLARATISRSHGSARISRVLTRAGIKKITPCGSAGLKAMMVARADAEVYLHPTRGGSFWDTCGPEAILSGAGGTMTDAEGSAIDYRGHLSLHQGIVASNSHLHAPVVEACKRERAGPGPS